MPSQFHQGPNRFEPVPSTFCGRPERLPPSLRRIKDGGYVLP